MFIFAGYGDVVPKTDLGKIFVIIIASIAIPVHIMLIASMGCHLNALILRIRHFIRRKCFRLLEMPKKDLTNATIIAMLLLFWLAIGGLLASKIQSWSYVSGLYFAFVTFSTIGYGDFTLDAKKLGIFGELVAWYTTIGLCLAAGVTDALVEALSYRALRQVSSQKTDTGITQNQADSQMDIELTTH